MKTLLLLIITGLIFAEEEKTILNCEKFKEVKEDEEPICEKCKDGFTLYFDGELCAKEVDCPKEGDDAIEHCTKCIDVAADIPACYINVDDCLMCDTNDQNKCTQCIPTYFLQTDSEGVQSCIETAATCTLTGCKTCSTENKCLECTNADDELNPDTGCTATSGGSTCTATGCDECLEKETTKCQKCLTDYFPIVKDETTGEVECIKTKECGNDAKAAGCSACSDPDGTCLQCTADTYLAKPVEGSENNEVQCIKVKACGNDAKAAGCSICGEEEQCIQCTATTYFESAVEDGEDNEVECTKIGKCKDDLAEATAYCQTCNEAGDKCLECTSEGDPETLVAASGCSKLGGRRLETTPTIVCVQCESGYKVGSKAMTCEVDDEEEKSSIFGYFIISLLFFLF